MANFGASYDAATAGISFRVFSANATRVELWLYALATGAAEKLRVQMDPTAADARVFEHTVSPAERAAAGIVSTVFHGYRAWGPNWTFDAAWAPGSAARFVGVCDASG